VIDQPGEWAIGHEKRKRQGLEKGAFELEPRNALPLLAQVIQNSAPTSRAIHASVPPEKNDHQNYGKNKIYFFFCGHSKSPRGPLFCVTWVFASNA
jgi:hypothetical protein